MSITVDAAQNGGSFVDGGTAVSLAFTNALQAGRRIVVACGMWNNGSAFGPFTDANCIKIAGTSNIGTVTLVAEEVRNTGTTFEINVGIWTAIVTTPGTCTMQVATFPIGSFAWIALMEVAATGGWSGQWLEATSTNAGNSTTPDTGNGSSVNGALFVAAFVGNQPTNSTITPDGAFTTCFESEDGTTHQPGSLIYRVVNSATTDSGSWTNAASDHWAAALAVLREQTSVERASARNFPKPKLRTVT